MDFEQTTLWWYPTKDPQDEAKRAALLLAETSAIEYRQSAWHELILWYSTLYTNRVLPAFRWGAVEADEELWPTNLRTENVVESIGEAMLAKASSSPIKPTPAPHGNSWETERACRILDNFMVGVWRQTRAEDAAVLAFRDAFMAGFGCVRVDYEESTTTLHVESVFVDSIIIDNRECVSRQMPQTYRIRQVLPRLTVEKRYNVELSEKQEQYTRNRAVADDYVVVVTAWRLPDPDGKNGRVVTACQDKLLEDKPWKHTWVPLVFFHWQDRYSGWIVKSGVEQLLPYQVRLNELNDDIQAAQDLCCRPRLLVNANSHLDVNQWDNVAGRFLMYSGNAPEPFQWPTAVADLYQERERVWAKAYSAMGLSEWFANQDAPQGVRYDSSAAVRENRNMEDSRHLRLWTRFEEFRLNIARTIMRVLSISKGAHAFTARYQPGGAKAHAEDIPYEAICTLTDDSYGWTLEATPITMMTPAARRELIRDYTSRGLLTDPEEIKRMEGVVNTENIEDLELAAADDIKRHLSILEAGGFEGPTELTNTTLGIQKVTANYHRLKNYSDVKPEVLEAHISWIVKAVSIQQQAVTPPQPIPFSPTQGMPGTTAALGGPDAPHTIVNDYGGQPPPM